MLMGKCPVCDGTSRVACTPGLARWKTRMRGYDAETDTLPCQNCGGQTMYGPATGQVRLRCDGVPCTHEYQGRDAGRCYTIYTCLHCGDSYDIDSGD
jgi:transcription elongation factor Elf1